MRHQHRRNAGIVVNDLALGETRGRVENFIEVRQLQLAPTNFDNVIGRQS